MNKERQIIHFNKLPYFSKKVGTFLYKHIVKKNLPILTFIKISSGTKLNSKEIMDLIEQVPTPGLKFITRAEKVINYIAQKVIHTSNKSNKSNKSNNNQIVLIQTTALNELNKIYSQKKVTQELNTSIKRLIDYHLHLYRKFKLKLHPIYAKNNYIYNLIAKAKIDDIKKTYLNNIKTEVTQIYAQIAQIAHTEKQNIIRIMAQKTKEIIKNNQNKIFTNNNDQDDNQQDDNINSEILDYIILIYSIIFLFVIFVLFIIRNK